MTLVAGVDSSTQSCKVVIRSLETGEVVRAGRASHPSGTEVDPDAWWSAFLSAVADCGGLADVDAISIAGQQHGMVCLDAGGRVVRPALLWNDTRSADAASALVSELGPTAWADGTGSIPVASFTSTKLRWLRDAEPDRADRTAAVALPHDYLTWRLRGFGPDDPRLDELVTDRSDASGTGYWSPSSEAYRHDLLEHAFGRTVTLPRVLGPADSAGTTARDLPGIPPGLVIGAGMGDNAGAALGLGASSGDVIVSIGTSGTVFAVTDTPTTDPTGTVAGFADATGAFLPLIATLNAARVLVAGATSLGVDHDRFSDLAFAAAPGADGLVLLPYLEGERTPNLPNATGSLHGITLGNARPETIARAMVEGMLCGLADGMDAVLAQGVRADRVLLIGGGAASGAVQSIAPQVLGLPVTVPPVGEYVAAGAARQAGWALSGSLPLWSAGDGELVERAPESVIRSQYAAAARAAGYR